MNLKTILHVVGAGLAATSVGLSGAWIGSTIRLGAPWWATLAGVVVAACGISFLWFVWGRRD